VGGPAPGAGPVDPAVFRHAMARWATGVSIVLARGEDRDVGMTVNAFLSISLRPPLLLVSLAHDADSTPVVTASGRFSVNVLRADQRALSDRFAQAIPAETKFGGVDLLRGRDGLPRLANALAGFECVVRDRLDAGDHRLFVGEVEAVHMGPDAPPLVFHGSRYATAEADGRLRLGGA
jgi:flavin reductase (DIM6/NTAB) family NADH-FMN oxidoreductase RutF